MRLIDANELKNWCCSHCFEKENCPHLVTGGNPCLDIFIADLIPTIEAIPVEWIDKYIAYDTNGRKSEMQPIGRMLEAWREEFEDDKCWENPRLA